MFYCERCGTSFNAAAARTLIACPRCRSKDGVHSPLSFRIFDAALTRRGRTEVEEAAADPTFWSPRGGPSRPHAPAADTTRES